MNSSHFFKTLFQKKSGAPFTPNVICSEWRVCLTVAHFGRPDFKYLNVSASKTNLKEKLIALLKFMTFFSYLYENKQKKRSSIFFFFNFCLDYYSQTEDRSTAESVRH